MKSTSLKSLKLKINAHTDDIIAFREPDAAIGELKPNFCAFFIIVCTVNNITRRSFDSAWKP